MSWRRVWGFFVFLLVLASLGGCVYLYLALRQEQAARAKLEKDVAAIGPRFDQFKDAVRDIGRHLSATVFQEVDLTAAGWQPISGGFYVIDLATSPADGGVHIAGKVINPTSVTHDAVQVSVRIGEKHATFSLPHMPPGVAQPFEVTVPAPAPPDHRAFIALESSTITFSSSSTRKRPGSEPVDTDKLLH
ncbi:MAG TPA: hypothetical protein VMT03_14490 [Polyangia bacterium]|nr:hypothetical protein [Polyangia bacterium]